MSVFVLVGLGLFGGVGAISRFLVDSAVQSRLGRRFPVGTLAVNVTGAFLLGLFVGLALDDDAYRLLGTGSGRTRRSARGRSRATATARTASCAPERRTSPSAWCSASWWRGWAAASGVRCERGVPEAHDVLRRARPREAGVPGRPDHGRLRRPRAQHEPGHARDGGIRREARIPHRPRADLSEDLPLVAVAVDTRPRVGAALDDLAALPFDGLIARARAHAHRPHPSVRVPGGPPRGHEADRLRGRHERANGRPAYEAVVGLLGERGIAGATVLLGLDGTAHGARRRAAFFGRNADVPLMIVSIGEGDRIAAVLDDLGRLLARPLVTLERVRLCKRDGVKLAEPAHLPETDPSGLGVWQKLMVYTGEQSRHDGHPVHHQLVRALRTANAAGATSVRGIFGYHGDHRPHGDTFRQLRRRVPIVTILIDTPERIRRWFAIVDELNDEAGLVTSEMVPAFRATGPAGRRGGLHLAERAAGGA